MAWEEISVFISSTFNDMHAERDYLLKNVFPQLGEWCERRHLFLRDIDLRWGIPPTVAEDITTQNTIYKCLKGVDRCRPFFLCFLGQRRGWMPKLDQISPLTRETFRELVEMVRSESHSATEYEIEHALLMPLACFENGTAYREEPVRNALFLRRRPDYLSALSPSQKEIFLDYNKEKCATPESKAAYLRLCREANERTYRRIREKALVLDYDCRWDRGIYSPELSSDEPGNDRAQGRLTDFTIRAYELPRELREELLALLESEFPEEVPSGEVWPLKAYLLAAYVRQLLPYCDTEGPAESREARDREQQRVFLQTSLRDTISRKEELDYLNAYCDGPSRAPLLVLAASGLGKTTLSAQFVKQRKGRVLYRFLGVSELSGDLLNLWDSIFSEAGLPAPPDLDTLKAQLPALLASMAPYVLLLDGLEQLPGGLALLELLPAPLPEGIKLILSVRSDGGDLQAERFLRFHRNWPVLRLRPLSLEQKKELIRTSLSTSLKELPTQPVDLLSLVCKLDESGNPLYLSILLSDLRSFGSTSRLRGEIERHGRTPLSAFDALLARMEGDRMFDMLPPARCVPLVFGLLAAARDGLRHEELCACLMEAFPEVGRERCAGSLQICLRQVRGFLRRVDGRTDFRHLAFRNAAQTRYAAHEQEMHAMLARLFRSECDPDGDGSFSVRDPRALREYAYQLSIVSEADHVRLYGDICWLNARCEGTYVRDLIHEYDAPPLRVHAALRTLLIRYRDGLEAYSNLLPSLLWAKGGKAEGFDRLRCAWLCTEELASAASEAAPAAEGTSLQILGETRYHAAAFCFCGDAPHAFAFTGRGQLTAYDLRTLLPLENPLYTAKEMPLGLCASKRLLAAAFDNENIELYAWEADGSVLRSRPIKNVRYLPPLYSGASLCFDEAGRLWFQPKEEQLASFDPASGEQRITPLPGAEELSSLAAASGAVYGTACVGQNTLLFCFDASGALHSRDLGAGDSRVLSAGENGCLVSCAASGSAYPLLLVNEKLETLRKAELDSPVTAATPLGMSYLLLPAKQTLGQLWLWDGADTKPIEQQLLYQDQAALRRLPDGSLVLLSSAAITHFTFAAAGTKSEEKQNAEPAILPEELPDLRRFELRDTKLYAAGAYACVAGVSASMRAVRDEQCAGAVFLKKTLGRWRVLGDHTWPRALELIRAVCIDPARGRFTMLFRSERSIHYLTAVQGTAQALCAQQGFEQELRLPQNRENFGCFAGGKLFLSAGELLQVYDADSLAYEMALLLPAPITAIEPDGEQAAIRVGGQTYLAAVQKGERT